jgi:regulator of RNase E activity RraA
MTTTPDPISYEDRALAARAAKIPTTVLSDLVADAGCPDQILTPSIQGFGALAGRIAGWATTVAGGPARPDQSGPDALKAEVIDAMQAGSLAVWSNGGIEGVCLFGDLLSAGMAARGVVGAVVDGGVRDIDDIAAIPFPLYARTRTPKASSGIWRVSDARVPIKIAGSVGPEVTVEQGDLVVADASGVLSIPRALSSEIVGRGEAYLVRERTIRRQIDAGSSLADLVREFGRL